MIRWTLVLPFLICRQRLELHWQRVEEERLQREEQLQEVGGSRLAIDFTITISTHTRTHAISYHACAIYHDIHPRKHKHICTHTHIYIPHPPQHTHTYTHAHAYCINTHTQHPHVHTHTAANGGRSAQTSLHAQHSVCKQRLQYPCILLGWMLLSNQIFEL